MNYKNSIGKRHIFSSRILWEKPSDIKIPEKFSVNVKPFLEAEKEKPSKPSKIFCVLLNIFPLHIDHTTARMKALNMKK